jgi:predicted DCC family thiol-disulfide oxidoreductase YuxK
MAGYVIYDGDCAFCSTAARFAQRRIAKNLSYQPYQFADLTALHLTQLQCQQALQFVKNNKLSSGHNAVIGILISGNLFFKLLGLILKLPLVNQLAKLGYHWIAKNRSKLPGGTPTCNL